jgi:AraC family transcriptional regulator
MPNVCDGRLRSAASFIRTARNSFLQWRLDMSEQVSETTVRGNVFLASMSSAAQLLEKLLQAAAGANYSDRAVARSTLESALSLLMTSRDALDVLRPGPIRGGLAPWHAQRVAAHISEHIGSRLKVSELAALVGLSYSHFDRAFRVSFQETPTAYIMRQRINLARDKMLTTRHSLSHVAQECGLCDQAHFSRIFRRIVGQSPHVWRRQFAPSAAPDQQKV